jgi:hypothetical protein
MARHFRSSPAKKIGSLKSSREKKNSVKTRLDAEKQLDQMSLGELYSLIDRKEQERMKEALLLDPLELARKSLLERAKELFIKTAANGQNAAATKVKKSRSRGRGLPIHLVLRPRILKRRK